MKRLFYAITLTWLFSVSVSFAQSHIPGDYVPNQVMVMLFPGNNIDDLIRDLNDDGLAGQYRLNKVLSKRYLIYLLDHDAILGDSKDLVYDIKKMDQVALAQLNHYVEERLIPNDPMFSTDQWNMNNTGTGGGVSDADIDAPEAWSIATGGVTKDGDTIVVAVIDGGAQDTHEDLTDNMWRNYVEISGTPGVDDDGNGYIDDVEGWDAQSDDSTVPGNSSHATHCSGIVGAKGNNSTGVVGVNWNVKVLNIRGSSGTESIVVIAYDYIASLRELYNNTNGASGAYVVATSNSFGVNNGLPASFPIWCAMYDTMGVLGILSAGAGPNQNWDIDIEGDIPTTCPSNYMIAVTNTTNTDAKYSTGAPWGAINMDIGAPGTTIRSCTLMSFGGYTNMTGTSMATPHVAGAIGLYYSGACMDFILDYNANPDSMTLVMRDHLLMGVDSIASMTTFPVTSKGRLNICKGLTLVSGIPVITCNNGSTLESSGVGSGNQWYYEGVLIPGATNDTYEATQGGEYSVIYTNSYGCSDTSAVFISTFGVEEPVLNFSIYPNPATEKLIIDAGTSVKADITLTDLSGRTVINTKMNQSLFTMDVSSLANGVYMIKIDYGAKSITRKIVKR